jgi:predicted peptidase
MPNKIPKLYSILLLGLVIVSSCKKENKPDPRKEANNSRIETVAPELRAVYQSSNSSSSGYYVALPSLYDSTTKSYPLIVSIHGAGQQGNGGSNLPAVLFDGIPHVISAGNFPPNVQVNGQNYSFIVFAPQFTRYPANAEIEQTINFAKKNYRVDAKRIYLTGLSMGGAVSWDAGAQYNSLITAIVPISGVPKDDGNVKAKAIAQTGLPVWAFHNENDDVTNSIVTKTFVQSINSFSPVVAPKMTIFKAEGHNAWGQATNPAYKENNMNIYEWMLQYSK